MMSESLRSMLWNRAPFQSPALFDRLGSSVSSLHELQRRNVEQLGLRAVGRRPEIVAAGHAPGTVSWSGPRASGFAGRNRPGCPCFGSYSTGLPVFWSMPLVQLMLLEIGLGQQGLAVVALERVEEAVARRMGDELDAAAPSTWPSIRIWDAGRVVVPHVARHILEIPVHLAGVGIPRDHAVGVEIVARPVGRIEHRHRIAGAPDHLVGGEIVGAGHPHGAAAGLPGVVLVLPGLAAGLAGRRNHIFAPDELAGRGIERRDEVAHAAVAAGGADDDLVLDRQAAPR